MALFQMKKEILCLTTYISMFHLENWTYTSEIIPLIFKMQENIK